MPEREPRKIQRRGRQEATAIFGGGASSCSLESSGGSCSGGTTQIGDWDDIDKDTTVQNKTEKICANTVVLLHLILN